MKKKGKCKVVRKLDFGLGNGECGLRIAEYGLGNADWGFRICDLFLESYIRHL